MDETTRSCIGRKLLCQWCICHRSDLVWNDLMNNVSEVRIWWMNIKDAVSFFRCCPQRCKEVRKHSGGNFRNFVNPPEVRMAEHLLQMCSAFMSNFNACVCVWKDMENDGDRDEKSKAKGFLYTWSKAGINFKLTLMLLDLLRILYNMQKRFQEDQLTSKIYNR